MNNSIIQVENLVKVYPSGVRALDGLTLAVQPGIVYGLLGPNGAGKTTLIRVLTTLLLPDEGSARVAGFDVRRDPDEVRKRIGLAGQYAAVDDFLTGRENVEMIGRLYGLSRSEARQRAGEVLERIHLVEAVDRLVKTYSGGMRRRLDLAASLVGRPQFLFLDEPTAGLDPASRIDLWRLIEELLELGTTVLLTTQYLDEADRLAGRIAVIDHGRLINEGSGEVLKERVGGSVLEMSVPDEDRTHTLGALSDLVDGYPAYDEQQRKVTLPAPDGSKTLIEALPPELDGVADEVHVHFPWGSLLRAVATGDEAVLRGLRRICAPGALVEIVIGLDPDRGQSAIEALGLEPLTNEFLEQTLIPRYTASGFEVLEYGLFPPSEWPGLNTSWAKRLRNGAKRSLIYLIARTKSPA